MGAGGCGGEGERALILILMFLVFSRAPLNKHRSPFDHLPPAANRATAAVCAGLFAEGGGRCEFHRERGGGLGTGGQLVRYCNKKPQFFSYFTD